MVLDSQKKEKKISIIMFGFNDWHQWEEQSFRTRNAIIAKKLAEHPKVKKLLVISTAKSFWINLYLSLKNKSFKNGMKKLAPFSLSKVSEKVYLLDHTRLCPREEAYEVYNIANGLIHDAHLTKSVQKIAQKLKMDNLLLWVSNPLMTKYIGRLNEKLSVFDAIDDWSVHPNKKWIRRSIRRGYKTAVKKADVIFTVSLDLAKRLGATRGDIFWVPNGVNTDIFHPNNYQIPSEMAPLSKPIIGYVGVLQERVDTSILEALARRIPNGSLILIGPLAAPNHFEHLKLYPNIYFLGEKPYEQIPRYLQFCDVCVLPHLNNEFTRSMNPLKLYEYLAMGKAVVATEIPGLEEFSGLIKKTSNINRFVQLVTESASTKENGSAARYQKFLQNRDWNTKVDQMLEIIDESLTLHSEPKNVRKN